MKKNEQKYFVKPADAKTVALLKHKKNNIRRDLSSIICFTVTVKKKFLLIGFNMSEAWMA